MSIYPETMSLEQLLSMKHMRTELDLIIDRPDWPSLSEVIMDNEELLEKIYSMSKGNSELYIVIDNTRCTWHSNKTQGLKVLMGLLNIRIYIFVIDASTPPVMRDILTASNAFAVMNDSIGLITNPEPFVNFIKDYAFEQDRKTLCELYNEIIFMNALLLGKQPNYLTDEQAKLTTIAEINEYLGSIHISKTSVLNDFVIRHIKEQIGANS